MTSIAQGSSLARIACCVCALTAGNNLFAQLVWNVDGQGEWEVAGNWSPVQVPGSGDDVVITTPSIGASATVTAFDAGGAPDVHSARDVVIAPNLPDPRHGISIGLNSRLRITGDIQNDGVITVDASLPAPEPDTNSAELWLAKPDTRLTGAGSIWLAPVSDDLTNVIREVDGPVRLVQGPHHAILGEGVIGGADSQLSIVNQGLFAANVRGQTLTIDPRDSLNHSDVTFDNQFVVQASGGGRLELATGTFSGGEYQALADSFLRVHGATVVDATFNTIDNGRVFAALGATLIDSTNLGDFSINNQQDLFLGGSFRNSGSVRTGSIPKSSARILLLNDVALSGGGIITLQENDRIDVDDARATLVNVDNTIQGTGWIGSETTSLAVVNQGHVFANVPGQTLTIDPRDAVNSNDVTFANHGLVQASEGGRIRLQSGVFGGDGVYQALAGSNFQVSGATAVGVTFATVDTGRIFASGDATLIDTTNQGSFRINNSQDLFLSGSFTNSGTVATLTIANASTEIVLNGDVVLSGGGTLTLQKNDRIRSTADQATLFNLDNIIGGRGHIDVDLVNNGALIGESAASVLALNGRLSGAGELANVLINGVHAPGNSTAVVPVSGAYEISNSGELHVAVQSPTPGVGHDQLSSSGTVQLNGDLVVQTDLQGSGYEAAPGDRFTIVQSTSPISGAFEQVVLPGALGQRLVTWLPADYSNPLQVALEIATVGFYAADFNEDGDVGATDLPAWHAGFGIQEGALHTQGDADGDGQTGGRDFAIWQRQLGLGASPPLSAIPEPTSWLLLTIAVAAKLGSSGRRRFVPPTPWSGGSQFLRRL